MYLTSTSSIEAAMPLTPPVAHALGALRRDMAKTLAPDGGDGGTLRLCPAAMPAPEGYALAAGPDALTITAGDDLGFVYGIYEVSRRFLGVQPFWFWNDQHFAPRGRAEAPDGFRLAARPARVRWRGWFINDETLIDHWKVERRPEGPWEMAFEALLRCGGNLVIPGTDANGRRYRALAAGMGLVVTHHHAEPLGAEMFARAYPALEPSFALYPEKFRALWRQAIEAQKGMRVIWNIGFRGQGDRPFWDDDPRYDTPEKRGALLSALIREQYDLLQEECPGALCCTNLYGETMELYRQGLLDLPQDVIRIWADNGYGRMVSRRQGNSNPRVPALPDAGDRGAHGLYYHASFYDLQAASHITALPNTAEFVCGELGRALARGVDDYWLINCSNIKPHVYLLDLIAALWREGEADPAAHRAAYAAAYYGGGAGEVAGCIEGYGRAAVPYGPNPDDRAGDQFYNHVPRMLMTAFMTDPARPADDLRWLADAEGLEVQNRAAAAVFRAAMERYGLYYRRCEQAHAALAGPARTLFADSLLLQADLYRLWAHGGDAVCQSLAAAFAGDWKMAFYQAGRGRQCYLQANAAMRGREHGKWIDFYRNECQTDVKQTAAVCAVWMGWLRTRGEGPHFYEWQREFFDAERDRRIMLILNTENHPTDDELWRMMEQRWGE